MFLYPFSPCLIPALIANSGAQGKHGIDVLRGSMHLSSLETSLHHHLIGAFHHPRTDRPSLLSIQRILHQVEAFAKILQLSLHCLTGFDRFGQARTSTPQQGGTATLKDLPTSLSCSLWHADSCL